MAECDVQELMSEAPCFRVLMPGDWEILKLVLLCRIAQSLDPMAECDPQELITEGKCFRGLMPGDSRVIELQLLCNISDSIVNALPKCGEGSPEGVVTGTICGQSYTDTLTGSEYRFTGTPGTNMGWI